MGGHFAWARRREASTLGTAAGPVGPSMLRCTTLATWSCRPRVSVEVLDAVDATLIWSYRDSLPYNNVGKRVPPVALAPLAHRGDAPRFGP